MSSYGGSGAINPNPPAKSKGFLNAILGQTQDKKLLEIIKQPSPEPEALLDIVLLRPVNVEVEPMVNSGKQELREVSEKNRLEPGLSVFAMQVDNRSPMRNDNDISKPQKNIQYDLYNNEDSEVRVRGPIGDTPGLPVPASPKEEFGFSSQKNNLQDGKDRTGRFASFHTGTTPRDQSEISPVRQPQATIFGD